jgi:hypothetical protein
MRFAVHDARLGTVMRRMPALLGEIVIRTKPRAFVRADLSTPTPRTTTLAPLIAFPRRVTLTTIVPCRPTNSPFGVTVNA